jgi:signal peptidase I
MTLMEKELNQNFSKRNPWIAAIITIILGPFIGMCYANKGRLAVYYLVISILPLFTIFISASAFSVLNNFFLILNFIGAIHCFFVVKKEEVSYPKWYSYGWIITLFVVVLLLTSLGFRHFLYEPFHLPGASMSPNVNINDYLFAEKFAYNEQPPQRGDIIIFKVPKLHNINYIKRIIGLPGENIQIKEGIVYINGLALEQKKIADFHLHDSKNTILPQFTEITPEGKTYEILNESTTIPLNNTQLYIIPENHYFVLGDNRSHSYDSRKNDIGFISREDILGKATKTIYNFSTHTFNP